MQRHNQPIRYLIAALALFCVPAFFVLFSFPAQATDLFGGEEANIQANIGLEGTHPAVIIARLINILLGLLGIITLGLVVYAGYLWMTSAGDPQKIEKAKKIISSAIIGLIIILASFGLVRFFLGKYQGSGGGGGNQAGGGAGLGVLGQGIVESHYPARNALDVVRNTSVVVTFREAIATSSIILDSNSSGTLGDCATPGDVNTCDKVNKANVQIYESKKGSAFALDNVAVFMDTAGKNFVFKPMAFLGSPSEKLWHTVVLNSGIKKADGKNAFGSTGYSWTFEIGTRVDSVPPQIMSIWPRPSATEPKNVVIQINFNEAVNPLSASGMSSSTSLFTNLEVSSLGAVVAGGFYVSNQYRTVEFLSDNPCGVNSCGQTVFCLPGLSDIDVLAKAASTTPFFPYNGVIDMADNSLDGNKDGKSDGPQAESGKPPFNANTPDAASQGDDYTWRFKTTDQVDIAAPVIEAVLPNPNAAGVGAGDTIEARFNKILMANSVSNNVVLRSAASNAVSFWPNCANDGNKTTVRIAHDPLRENAKYSPDYKAGIKDIYQNCYKPCGGTACPATTAQPSCCNNNPTAGAICP